MTANALVVEGIYGGLQNRLCRFDSGPVLHAVVAQLVERILAKDEVAGSNPVYCSMPP